MNNITKLSLVSSAVLASTLSLSGEASAQMLRTGVFNEYRNGNNTSTMTGRVNIEETFTRRSVAEGTNRSESLKMESNGPGFAYARVDFKPTKVILGRGRPVIMKGGLTGSAYANNRPQNPDPIAQGTYNESQGSYKIVENASSSTKGKGLDLSNSSVSNFRSHAMGSFLGSR